MKDLSLRLLHRPGSLAEMGEVLGREGISVEGGGVFVVEGVGVAHFLVADDDAVRAEAALRAADIEVEGAHDVVLARLRQDVPGQLGALCARLGSAGVSITTQYSDHDGQLVLVVDDPDRAAAVRDAWQREQSAGA